MAKKTPSKTSITDKLNELETIQEWFTGDSFQLDQGLEKLRQGRALITECRQELARFENEFIEVKKEFDLDIERSKDSHLEPDVASGERAQKPMASDLDMPEKRLDNTLDDDDDLPF
ncbi:MAG: hypothetical protein ACOCXQ_04340 [Patescibacteria group bacterium]